MSDFKLVADSPYPIHLVKCCIETGCIKLSSKFSKIPVLWNNIKYMIDAAISGTRVK
jgi:hypothetical protein